LDMCTIKGLKMCCSSRLWGVSVDEGGGDGEGEI
jgi:hypothetical protein